MRARSGWVARGILLRQRGKVYVVTCTALAEGGDPLDPLFERTMKTFRLEGREGRAKAGP